MLEVVLVRELFNRRGLAVDRWHWRLDSIVDGVRVAMCSGGPFQTATLAVSAGEEFAELCPAYRQVHGITAT